MNALYKIIRNQKTLDNIALIKSYETTIAEKELLISCNQAIRNENDQKIKTLFETNQNFENAVGGLTAELLNQQRMAEGELVEKGRLVADKDELASVVDVLTKEKEERVSHLKGLEESRAKALYEYMVVL